MASASEILSAPSVPSYDNSSPVSYQDWKDYNRTHLDTNGKFFHDFGVGFVDTFNQIGGLFGIGKYGRKNYNDYVSDFYNKQNIKNTALSEQYQKDFEEYMSSSAIQRQMLDAQKAGLNPVYAVLNNLNGASTPSSANAITRSSSSSSSRSENQSRSTSNSATAVIAALIFLLSKGLVK